MNAGATADRVYAALKDRIMANGFRPADRLDPAALADQLSSSVTPVRDALHRLVGERLVEARSGTGFHLAALSEPDLRDLYAWNVLLLVGAVRIWPTSTHRAPPPLPDDRSDATRLLFGHIGALAGNREACAAIESSNDRLAAIRQIEPIALGPFDDELATLVAALVDSPAALVREIRAFHRRRLAAVPALVRLIYRGDAATGGQ